MRCDILTLFPDMVAPVLGPTAVDTGIILSTSDIEADHATLKAAGVDVDAEVARWGNPVPPMFRLRDPGGNTLTIVEPTE